MKLSNREPPCARKRRFAHALVERADVSVIHGHSSHHPKAIEVYRDRLILYGCGDFLNDYEGIEGYEKYRGDLVLMYFADIEPAGSLAALEIVPLLIRNFQLVRPSSRISVGCSRPWTGKAASSRPASP